MIIGIVFLQVFLNVTGSSDIRYTDLQQEVTADIVHLDGTAERDVSDTNWTTAYGEEIVFHVALPKEKIYEHTSLVFDEYNASVEVRLRDQVLYEYGKDLYEKNTMIGHILVKAELPDDAWGEEVTITLQHAEQAPAAHNSHFRLMPISESYRYPLIGKSVLFYLFFGVLFFSAIGSVVSIGVLMIRRDNVQALWLSLFTLLISQWYLGFNNMLPIFMHNTRFCAMAEYYALTFSAYPIIQFVRTTLQSERFKKLLSIWGWVILAYCAISIGIGRSPLRWNMSETLIGVYITLGLTFAILIYILLHVREAGQENLVMLHGIFVAFSITILQIVVLLLEKIPGLPSVVRRILDLDYGSISLLSFIITLVLSYSMRLMDRLRASFEQEELRKLAYLDITSGIHNRSFVVEEMKKLEQEKDRRYKVAFVDADGLKNANDTFGHEMGDALIKGLASSVEKAFGDMEGFYGRWGGDEFLAFFLHPEDADQFDLRFHECLKNLNETENLPFTFSASVGYAVHDAHSNLTPTEIVNEADDRMYTAKQAAKKARALQ